MTALCPMCSKPALAAVTPFCSDRCRKLDLNRWFTGAYAVPAVELDDIDDEALEQAMPQEKGENSQ